MFQAGFALVFPEFSHFFNFLIFILFSGFTRFSLFFSLEWLGPSHSKSTKFVV